MAKALPRKMTRAGFNAIERTGVVLNVGDRLRIDFPLLIGGAAQTATVDVDATHIQTDTGEISDVISGQQVSRLETNGQSLYPQVNVTPGATSHHGVTGSLR